MSVIGYSKSEVVEAIASCWARGSAGSSDALRHMEWLAEAGNALLKANDEAYRATYGEPDGPDADLAAVPDHRSRHQTRLDRANRRQTASWMAIPGRISL